jgi:predicted dehydrogenase
MVDLARERSLTLGVFENVRQDADVRAAAWAVRRGLIGQTQLTLMGSLAGLWSPDRVVADTGWRHHKLEGGGGGSIDIGVHQMHWMRYVVGEIATVSATARTLEPHRYRRDNAGSILEDVTADVDDTYLATVGFEHGAVGQLLWSWALHGEALEIPGTPAIYGSTGCIRGERLLVDGEAPSDVREVFESSITPDERDLFFPLGLRDPFAIQQLDWLRAIERAGDPETSGREGLLDLACAYSILESSTVGRTVSVQEVLEGHVDTYQGEIDASYHL